MADHEPLFSPALISDEVASSLPQGFTIRPLHRQDFRKGYLDCLRVLTWVGDLTEEEWNSRFDEMARATGTYYLLALEHGDRIVGTGSLVVERKLYVWYQSPPPHSTADTPRTELSLRCGELTLGCSASITADSSDTWRRSPSPKSFKAKVWG